MAIIKLVVLELPHLALGMNSLNDLTESLCVVWAIVVIITLS